MQCTFDAGRVGIYSTGAPPLLASLNGEWHADAKRPEVAGRPHFLKPVGGAVTLHLYYSSPHESWHISTELGAANVYAAAASDALHPNTVARDAWRLACGEPGGFLVQHKEFEIATHGPNTAELPFTMDQIGRDYFLRVSLTPLIRQVVWFRCPATGEVYHSAAKSKSVRGEHATRGLPGKRHCSLCSKCFSANNFHSQHLANMHRPRPPSAPTVTSSATPGSLSLSWAAPAGELPVLGYCLRFRVDGGPWQMGRENTQSRAPSFTVSNLYCGYAYSFQASGPPAPPCAPSPPPPRPQPSTATHPDHAPISFPVFQVAAVNLAGTGAFGPASEPFVFESDHAIPIAADPRHSFERAVRARLPAAGAEPHEERSAALDAGADDGLADDACVWRRDSAASTATAEFSEAALGELGRALGAADGDAEMDDGELSVALDDFFDVRPA